MFCEKCGSKLKDGAQFCSTCGTPVKKTEDAVSAAAGTEINTPVENNETNKTQPAPSVAEKAAATAKNMFANKKFLIMLGTIAAAAVVAVVLIVNSAANTPGGVVQKYMDAAKNGNSQAAMECYASPGIAFDDDYADTFSYVCNDLNYSLLFDETIITEVTYRSSSPDDTGWLSSMLMSYGIMVPNVSETATVDVYIYVMGEEVSWYEFICANVNGQWKLVGVY